MISLKGVLISTIIFYGVGLISIKLYLKLVHHGFGVPNFNHFPGKCRVMPQLECGSEDVAVTKDGLAFISNGLRIIPKCDHKLHKGGIYLFDYKNPTKNVTRLEIVSKTINWDVFDPHGLSLWENQQFGNVVLFLIDHGSGEKVHLFEYKRENKWQLVHKETISDALFVCINDLVATGPRSFYITNYIAFCHVSQAAVAAEFFLNLPTGSVAYYDGKKATVVAKGLLMSNGINLSPDGHHLYVAAGSAYQVLIFKRDIDDNTIRLTSEVDLMTSPDNIEVDFETGDLYIGCHSNYRLPFSEYNGTFAAPSQVIQVKAHNKDWGNASITEILRSDGINFVRGSSVASFYKGGLLIGTVFHRLAYCEMCTVYEIQHK